MFDEQNAFLGSMWKKRIIRLYSRSIFLIYLRLDFFVFRLIFAVGVKIEGR